jgi:hypothetical protein
MLEIHKLSGREIIRYSLGAANRSGHRLCHAQIGPEKLPHLATSGIPISHPHPSCSCHRLPAAFELNIYALCLAPKHNESPSMDLNIQAQVFEK